MSSQTIQRLLTDKNDVAQTDAEVVDVPYSCAHGDVVLEIVHVAITTNNITYAAFGDEMDYWKFFPSGIDGKGLMPVWGFADVVASETEGVEVGERFFGYFPVASHLIVKPTGITPQGFRDGAEHRQELVSVYNRYGRCVGDPGYRHDREFYQSLVRPLFITSYMLVDFLSDNSLFEAEHLVFSSASSKTAFGAAYCLRSVLPDVPVTALTSSRNVGFVESLGLYNDVHSYDDLKNLRADLATTYVDFAGNESLRKRVHKHYGDMLNYDCLVGATQNSSFTRIQDLPGPRPAFFFAPVQIKKRSGEHGTVEVMRQFSAVQNEFIDHLASVSPPWMKIVEHQGMDGASDLVTELAQGISAAETGNVVIIQHDSMRSL